MTDSSPTNPGGSRHSSSDRGAEDDKTPITVYDPKFFSPEATQTQRGSSTGSNEALTELPDESNLRPATPQERFAAFFVDLIVFGLLAAAVALLLKTLKGDLGPPAYIGALSALYFLYYFVFEAWISATPGKLLAGLRVREEGRGRPSLPAVLVRNLMRLVDYPLFFFAAVGAMEATRKQQRFGDVLARTLVVRKVIFEARRLPPEITPLAGATRRGVAWMLDLLIAIPLAYGIFLLAPVSRPMLAAVIVNLALPLTLLAFTVSETVLQATPGKVLLGMKVAQEDGRPARFASLWLRNVFKLLDANPIGYLCVFLSSRKQRPGDAAAGTLVFRDRRGFRGWLAIPSLGLIALLVAFAGLKNPDSFLRRGVGLKIGPYEIDPVPEYVKRLPALRLGILIDQLQLGFNEQEPNPEKVFTPGQVVYLLFRISGYTRQGEKAWIQADVRVHDREGNLILDRSDAINSSIPVGARKSARLITRFALHPQARAGTYLVTLTVRDMFSGRGVERTETLIVR